MTIWCNSNPKNGPTARPVTKIGGHLCCQNADLCNKDLVPTLWDYRNGKEPVLYKEGDALILRA